jgi:hypothetical protein
MNRKLIMDLEDEKTALQTTGAEITKSWRYF